MFDRLAEEFARRCRRGEDPSISEYAARFPVHTDKIRKLFPTVALMEQLKRGIHYERAEGPVPPPPSRLGEFKILREVGRGGMGVVYEAIQESLDRHVALKVLHHVQTDATRLQRFRREAQAVAHLHHTNIVPIFGVGEHEGLPYYAMQFIRGDGLDALLKQWRGDKPPRLEERWKLAARIGCQAAEALQYAHEQGVLHRDIKPANLLVDEHRAVWVTDFGLAKLSGHDDLTATGDVIGTLRYLAPEALRGENSPRSDVYGLGLTLYELLTLNPPYGSVSASELLHRVSEGELTRPRKLDPAIPRDLETIVLKAIAREPGDRYATAGALADDLQLFLEDRPILARRTTAAEHLWRWGRRNRVAAVLSAAAVGSLLLAAVVGWVGYASTMRELRRADENVALSLEVFGDLFDKLTPRIDFFRPHEAGSSARRSPFGPGPGPGPAHKGGPPGGPRHGPPPRDRDGGPPPDGPGHGPPPDGPGHGPPPPPPPDDDPGGRPPSHGREPGIDHGVPPGVEFDMELLQSMLSFYERFAQRNAMDPRLQVDAARAYLKVGELNDRMGRDAGARTAYSRAASMFEGLVASYPEVVEHRMVLDEIRRRLGALEDPGERARLGGEDSPPPRHPPRGPRGRDLGPMPPAEGEP